MRVVFASDRVLTYGSRLVFHDASPPPPDTTPPSTTSRTPELFDTGVSIDPVIEWTFDEPIQAGTGSIVVSVDGGSTVESFNVETEQGTGAGQVEISGNRVRVRLTSNLTNNTGYEVNFPAGVVTDLASNDFAGAVLTFTTVEAGAMTVPDLAGNAEPMEQTLWTFVPTGNTGTPYVES